MSRSFLEKEDHGDIVVATVTPKKILDETLIQALGSEVLAFAELPAVKVVFDFCQVEYMSSAFVGKLLKMARKMEEAAGKWKLCGIRPEIYEMLEIMQVHNMLPIVATQDEALLQLQ